MVAVLKTVIGFSGCMAIVLATFFTIPWMFLPGTMFQLVVPFSWILMIADDTTAEPLPLVRGMLGLMAAFLSLYSFPVSGIQTALASLLTTIMLPVLLNDGVRHPDIRRFLTGLLRSASANRYWRDWLIPATAYTLMLAMLVSQTLSQFERYQSFDPLNLPGASLLRADRETARLYRWAASKLAECHTFYSVPNLPSLYFWANQTSPTGMLNNDVIGLLSFGQQQKIIEDLEPHRDLCILTRPILMDLFDRGQLATKPPLLKYVKDNFIEAESNGPFHLLRRRSVE